MKNKQEFKGLKATQIQTDVTLLAFFAAAAVFFVGILLSQYQTLDTAIKVPISFLIISIFAFLFSSLILANATSKFVNERFAEAQRHILYGYIISEYFGIYLFVFSMPLVINIITPDGYLRSVTIMSTIIGLTVYQFMGFSLLKEYFVRHYRIYATLSLIMGFALCISQIFSLFFVPTACVVLLFIFLVTILAPNRNIQ